MEHINQHLSVVQQQIMQPPSTKAHALSITLLPEEKRILEVKYASRPFAKMQPREAIMAANTLIIKINVITGWLIPAPELAEVLKDQLIKKLSESYGNVNMDEVEYAFRAYGTTVKDWGKQMNLSLIDEVMIPYLEKRAAVSRIEEQKEQLTIEHKEDMSDKAMQDWIEATKKQIKEGLKVDFVPVMQYDWLFKRKEIVSHETKLLDAAKFMKIRIAEAATDNEGQKAYKLFAEMWNKGEFSDPFDKEIEAMAKKMVVFEYLHTK